MLSQGKKFFPYLFILTLFAATLLALSLSSFDIGLSNDSVAYYAAAESFFKTGSFFLPYHDNYFTDWPPLFSVILSTAFFFDIKNKMAFYGLQMIVVYFAVVISVGILANKLTKSRILPVLTILIFTTSPATYITFSYLWSESFFIVFTIMFLVGLVRFIETENQKFLFFCAVTAGLSILTRYAGIVNILTGFIFLFFYSSSSIRYKRVLVFISISFTPVILWFIRNFYLSSTLTGGGRTVEPTNIKYAVFMLSKAIWQWFLPYPEVKYGGITTTILVCLLFIVTCYYIVSKFKENLLLLVLILNTILFIILIFLTSVFQSSAFADYRLTAPAFFSFLLVLIFFIKEVLRINNKLLSFPLLLIFVIVFTHNSLGYINYLKKSEIIGIEGYNDLNSKSSETIQYLQQTEWQSEYKLCKCAFTDSPEKLYYFNIRGVLSFTEGLGSGKTISRHFKVLKPNKIVIWFGDLTELESLLKQSMSNYKIDTIQKFSDGSIVTLLLKEGASPQKIERLL